MIIIGHRGAAGHADENTVTSVALALEQGADGVEFDVRAHGDLLIALHDPTVDRTTNGRGTLESMTRAQRELLRTPSGATIPLLADMLVAAAPASLVNVEIKQPGIADQVADEIDRFIAASSASCTILLSSFDAATTDALAEHCPPHRLGVLYEGDFDHALARARALSAWSLHLPVADVSAARINATTAAGLRSLVYTVNTARDFRHCLACGVDGVFSDYPDRMRDALAARAEEQP